MTEAEFLAKFDRYIERLEQREDGYEAAIDFCNETLGETNRIHGEHRDFVPEITRRQEHVTQLLVSEISARTEEIRAETARAAAKVDDLQLASTQHTQALARMLDRLD